jgi:CubicO group peptidase (beta-lactamase class C family)
MLSSQKKTNFNLPPLSAFNNSAMKLINHFLAGTFTFICFTADAQTSSNDVPNYVDSLVNAISKNHPIASISIAIKQDGKILVEKAYGLANVELRVPATIHSIYKLNSISKMFTAISILQLAEQGRLSVDDEIDKWLPGYDSFKKHITIRQLLSHSSGFKNYGGESWRKNYKSFTMTAAEWVELSKNAPLDFPPGTSYSYSNAGFDLLAFIVEKASGELFPAYISRHILAPAGLKETGHYRVQTIVPGHTTLYDVIRDTLYRCDEWGEPAYGSGAIHASIDDVLKFQDALNKNILLKASSLQQMRTSLTINGQNFSYGFGTRIVVLPSHVGYGHTGSGGGSTSVLHYFPADDVTIAVLMNSENDDDSKYPAAPSIARSIEERIFNIITPPVKDLPIPKDEIDKYTGDWGPDPNITIFRKGDQLWARRGTGDSIRLFYQGDHKFIPDNNHSVVVDFEFENGHTDLHRVYINGSMIGVGKRKK